MPPWVEGASEPSRGGTEGWALGFLLSREVKADSWRLTVSFNYSFEESWLVAWVKFR